MTGKGLSNSPGSISACRGLLQKWPGGVLTLFSDQDPVTAGGYKPFQKLLPGAKDQPHATIEGAGHFLQEDAGEEIAQKIIAWLGPAAG